MTLKSTLNYTIKVYIVSYAYNNEIVVLYKLFYRGDTLNSLNPCRWVIAEGTTYGSQRFIWYNCYDILRDHYLIGQATTKVTYLGEL